MQQGWGVLRMTVFFGAAILGTATSSAQLPGVVDITATAQGWSSSLGLSNAYSGNAFVGRYIGATNLYRNWFVFDVPALTSRVVQVGFVLNTGEVRLPRTCRSFRLRAVATPPATVLADPSSAAVYADLGAGTIYGETYICYFHDYSNITLPLAAGIEAAVGTAQGGKFVLGGSLEDLTPGSDEPEYACDVYSPAHLVLWLAAPPVVVTNASGFDVAFGYSAGLTAEVFSAEPCIFQWRFNGKPVVGATNSTLWFAQFLPEQAGSYDLLASNASGSVTSTVALAAGHLFDFNMSSQTVTLPEGSTLLEYAGVGGQQPVALQWRKDGVDVPGATSGALFIPYATVADCGRYVAVVSNVFGVATSPPINVVVYQQVPVFTQEPGGRTNYVGDFVYLSSAVSAAPEASFQWFHNGIPIPDATGYSLRFPALQRANAGDYYVVAGNSVGTTTSQVATIRVIVVPPYLDLKPLSKAVFPGGNHLLNTFVHGSPPIILQWWKDDQPIAGATNDSLALTAFAAEQAGRYYLLASNDAGIVTGRVAVVSLAPGGPADFWEQVQPTNDNYHLYSLAVGNGKCIAVGGNGKILCSHDGATFSEIPSFLTNRLRVVAFAGSNFLAAGEGGLLLRFSGETNSTVAQVALPTTKIIAGIAVAPDAVILVGNDGVVLFSTNGSSFQPAISPNNADFRSVAWGNERFVAVGSFDPDPVTGVYPGCLIVSSNGVDWSDQTPPGAARFFKVTFLDGMFMALGQNSGLWSSADGLNWVRRGDDLLDYDARLMSLARGAGQFLLVGNNPITERIQLLGFTSWDGINWTARVMPANFPVSDSCFFGGRWILAGFQGAIWRSRLLAELRLSAAPSGMGLHLGLAAENLAGVELQVSDNCRTWTSLSVFTNGFGSTSLNVDFNPERSRQFYRLVSPVAFSAK
jgi:hypothetical protein